MSSTIELMVTSDLPATLMNGLQRVFVVHHRQHIREPAVLARIQAVVVPEGQTLGRDIMGLLPNLRLIAVVGAHTRGVDQAEAQKRRITVLPTPDVVAQDVADLAFGLLLGLARRIPMADQFVRAGDWVDGPFALTHRVAGSRLGLVGFGETGRAIVRRAQGFDMTVSYTDAAPSPDAGARFVTTTLGLAGQSDALILLSATALAQCGKVSADVLAALGPRGVLIHLAPGAVLDDALLAQTLQARQLGGVASDCHPEAPKVSPVLRQARPVIVTPAMAGLTHEANEALARALIANVQGFFAGTAAG